MSELHGFERRMVERARAELAADVDMSDDREMARKIGRLEVALSQMLDVIERADGRESD